MTLRNRASRLTASIMAFLIPALAAAQAFNPTAKLGIWEGRWTYNERDFETPYSHAHTNSGTGDCNWAPNRGFMICDYFNRNPGNGVPANDLGVFSYSSATHTYARLGIFKDAKPFAEHVTIKGNTWTTSADIPYKGGTLILRDVYVFSQDGKRSSATTEISADKGKTWTTISQFAAVKASTQGG